MYVTFLRNCFWLACSFALPAVVIILPVNTQGGNNLLDDADPDYVAGMGIITMGNVDPNGRLIPVHILFTWIFSLLSYLFVFVTYKQFMWIRRKWMKQNTARAYTIMLEELPHKLRKSKKLLAFAQKVFPGEVKAAHVAYNTRPVRVAMDKRRSYIKQYEIACMKHNKKTVGCIPWPRCCFGGQWGPDDPVTKDGWHGCFIGLCGAKIEAKELFERKIRKYEKLIGRYQKRPWRHLNPTGVGFVTFNSTFFAHSRFFFDVGRFVKKRPINDTATLAMAVNPAPEPTDVKWSALGIMRLSFIVRSILVTILMGALICLWSFPTLAVAFVTNLEAVSKVDGFGWLSFVQNLPGFIRGLIQGLLPPVTMAILNALIYPIIKVTHVWFQGTHQRSFAMWLVMRVFWLYLIVNVLLVVTIGGTIFKVLQQVIDDPVSVFDLLALSLPQQSLFFMLYILVSGLSRKPLMLFRIGGAIKWVFCIYMAKNKKRRNQAQIPGALDYAQAIANDLLIFTILMVYCVMSPLVSVFAVMYFGFVYMASRHNLIYTHINRWESGANMWRAAYHMIMAATLLFQLTMLGIFAVGQSTATPALAPPIVFTVLLWLIMHWSWSESSYLGSVNDCARDDLKFRPEFCNAYLDPALRPEYMSAYNFEGPVPGPETPAGPEGRAEVVTVEPTDVEMQELPLDEKDNKGNNSPYIDDSSIDVEYEEPGPYQMHDEGSSSSDSDGQDDGGTTTHAVSKETSDSDSDSDTDTDTDSDSDSDRAAKSPPTSPPTGSSGKKNKNKKKKKQKARNKDFADRAAKLFDFMGNLD
eukprot:TRINITY_DN774_c1_g1_i5.p1 TRINITY_DN774_c1_g1~~TRINITY_DN774_c1_g1_i5.p1  ORF type:complete len:808 (-),score=132.34 TRINITY_DN774_c1_g1_i5:75-2498(-)